ncbi:hypothetical protein NLI96_g6422 [Meripilus lineatus]|uniref:BTB domain-containing protein n=1 Tax=Meripilus lineatus TaxID=2056292 RepID=A0AAD5V131_9APHY|nr:hypothetical protein NLI96_g6422 [Physisporinus lineatus]
MQADSETTLTPDSNEESNYHPQFNSPDSDTILGSKDGYLFRVHSYTLKTTSGWFRTMFSLPQQGSSAASETIFVDEDYPTLEALLRMVCGLPIPRLDSFEIIEPVLYAAEKYDMPGPLSIIRALLMTGPLLSDPLRLYTIACRYGWDHEARQASTQTLTLNLHSPTHRQTLMKLSTEALLNLVDLHHRRREALRKRLNEHPFVNDSGDTTCANCQSSVNYHTWRELKYVIVLEMDVRPLGDTILNGGLGEWPAAKACWNAKCEACGRVLYDRKETLKGIRECIDQLPKTVEYSNPLETAAAIARLEL